MPWHLLFVEDISFFHLLVEIYTKTNLDRMWLDINKMMMDNTSLQVGGMGHGGLLFLDFYKAI
jgi:hypothetical protein